MQYRADQFHDRTLTCRDCHGEFAWTAQAQAEQAHSLMRRTVPQRCRSCRDRQRGARPTERDETQRLESEEVVRIVCSVCGDSETYPLIGGLPESELYCRKCQRVAFKPMRAWKRR